MTRRRGLSLLEVILAIAILGGSMAVIGELIRTGTRQAEEARELTKAMLLCESKMEEVAAGATAPESVSNAPCETDPNWTYAIEVSSLDDEYLIQVQVSVQQAQATRLIPLSFTLTRWMIDPDVELELLTLGAENEEMADDSGESGSTTSAGGGASESSDASAEGR